MSGAALGALPSSSSPTRSPPSRSATGAACSVLIAIGATVLPSFFLNAALHRISAQANATIGTLSPVMTIVLAVVILGEPLTLVDVFGTALVLAGVGWFTLAERSRRRSV